MPPAAHLLRLLLIPAAGCCRPEDDPSTRPIAVFAAAACAYGSSDEGCAPGTACAHVKPDQPPRCVPFATEDRPLHVTVSRLAPDQRLEAILREPGWAGMLPVRVRYELDGAGASRALWSDELPAADREAEAPVWRAP